MFCYDQEKKKLWVDIEIRLNVLSPSVRLFHTPLKLQPLSRIKCESYEECCRSSLIMALQHHVIQYNQ